MPRRARWVGKLRRELPKPTFVWPSSVVAAIGILAYGAVTLAIAQWAYDALAWRHVITAALLGALWNVSLSSYIGQIALNLLYLSPGGIRDIETKLGQRMGRLATQWTPLTIATGALVVLATLRFRDLRIPEAAAAVTGFGLCIGLWWTMARRPGSSSEVSVQWLTQLRDGGLAADGTDIPELIPLTPLGAGIQVMVARGDLLRHAARWLQDLAAVRIGLGAAIHACFVSDRHGQIIYYHGDRCRLRLLGWDTRPVHVAQLYAEGRFAARIVGDFARHAGHGQVVELELLGAGPVTTANTNPEIPLVPVRVHVITLNPDSLNAGYIGLVTMQSNTVRFRPARVEEADPT